MNCSNDQCGDGIKIFREEGIYVSRYATAWMQHACLHCTVLWNELNTNFRIQVLKNQRNIGVVLQLQYFTVILNVKYEVLLDCSVEV